MNQLVTKLAEKIIAFMFEMYQARTFNKHRTEKKSPSRFLFLIRSLALSDRRCVDPVDYVYGVLGMFQLKIPRMNDPNAVWQRFLSELEKYVEDMKNDKFEHDGRKYKISAAHDRAYRIDLREAENMSDVYGELRMYDYVYSDNDSDSE